VPNFEKGKNKGALEKSGRPPGVVQRNGGVCECVSECSPNPQGVRFRNTGGLKGGVFVARKSVGTLGNPGLPKECGGGRHVWKKPEATRGGEGKKQRGGKGAPNKSKDKKEIRTGGGKSRLT